MHRNFGRARNCAGCRFWSEMLAESIGGKLTAVCLGPKSPHRDIFVAGAHCCAAWKIGNLGAVDDPDSTVGAAYAQQEAREGSAYVPPKRRPINGGAE